MNVAARLKEMRNKIGISGNKLAKLSGIAQSTINDIEHEKIQPSVETLQRICEALGVTMSDFFADESPKIDLIKRLSNEQRIALNLFLKTLLK